MRPPKSGTPKGNKKKRKLPNVISKIGAEKPTKELIDFYRQKLAQYDHEREAMLKKLSDLKMSLEKEHKLHLELQQRDKEIVELQKTLSDMQVYLFQEREHVLHVYAENDRLKLREMEDRKRIQQLLTLSGGLEEEVTFFLKNPPDLAPMKQLYPDSWSKPTQKPKRPSSANKGTAVSQEIAKLKDENENLKLQMAALQKQMDDQKRLSSEHVEALMEDRRAYREESDLMKKREATVIQGLRGQLERTQNLLYQGTKDLVELQNKMRREERSWIEDRDALIHELELQGDKLGALTQQLEEVLQSTSHYSAGPETGKTVRTKPGYQWQYVPILSEEERQSGEIFRLKVKYEKQLEESEFHALETQKLCDTYREQCINLEEQLCIANQRNEELTAEFKEKSEKITAQLQMMKRRYRDLERRRNLEAEGFRTDVRMLRGKLKDLEKQLVKVTLVQFGDNDNRDLEVLQDIRDTAVRSRNISEEVRQLKAKIYSLENDLRHL